MESVRETLPLERLLNDSGFDRPDSVDAILKSVRTHLGMDVAFIAEFGEHDRLMRHVDAAGVSPISPGDRLSLEVGYCQRVVDGRLPQLIVNANNLPAAAALPETQAIPIGSHISVPIRLRDGELYGTFCCFSFVPDDSITDRDLRVMRAFADILADQINRHRQGAAVRKAKEERIQLALNTTQPRVVFQPIYDLATKKMRAVEALARFHIEPLRSPDIWFSEAAELGLGTQLEAQAIRHALEFLPRLPANVDLTLNMSPEVVFDGVLPKLLQRVDLKRIVAEITEHAAIYDYAGLLGELAPLRERGLRLAVDDAGAGYSGLRHILEMEPDLVKLDVGLTRSIDHDRKRRALTQALIAFARETQVELIAEGVETASELTALSELGIGSAQGFHLARPMEFDQLANWMHLP